MPSCLPPRCVDGGSAIVESAQDPPPARKTPAHLRGGYTVSGHVADDLYLLRMVDGGGLTETVAPAGLGTVQLSTTQLNTVQEGTLQ